MRLSERLKGLSPFSYCGTGYPLRLDANESGFPMPKQIKDEVLAAIASLELNRYPDDLTAELRKAFGRAFSVDPDIVAATNGSDEVINMIVGRIVPDNGLVLGFERDFGSYWSNAAIFGRRVVKLPRREDMSLDCDLLIDRAKELDADLVIFSNPNNPSGSILSRDEVLRIITSLNCLVAVDEAYMDFADQSVLDLAGKYENLIVLRTLSKAMGLAGARLGFAAATPELIYALNSVRDAYNVNSLSQAAGTVLLNHPEYLKEATAAIKDTTSYIYARLCDMAKRFLGMRVYPTNTNFILVYLDDAAYVDKKLREKGISLRVFDAHFMRISAGERGDVDTALDALEEILSTLQEDRI